MLICKSSLYRLDINPLSDECNVNLFFSLCPIFLIVCFSSISCIISESLFRFSCGVLNSAKILAVSQENKEQVKGTRSTVSLLVDPGDIESLPFKLPRP